MRKRILTKIAFHFQYMCTQSIWAVVKETVEKGTFVTANHGTQDGNIQTSVWRPSLNMCTCLTFYLFIFVSSLSIICYLLLITKIICSIAIVFLFII